MDLCNLAWWQRMDDVTPTGVGSHPGAQYHALYTSPAPPYTSPFPLHSPFSVISSPLFHSSKGEIGPEAQEVLPPALGKGVW